MTSANDRKAKLEELSSVPRRGARRFTAEQEQEILKYVAMGHTYANIARVFAKDEKDKKEVKNLGLIISLVVKRHVKAAALATQQQDHPFQLSGDPTDIEEEVLDTPRTKIFSGKKS